MEDFFHQWNGCRWRFMSFYVFLSVFLSRAPKLQTRSSSNQSVTGSQAFWQVMCPVFNVYMSWLTHNQPDWSVCVQLSFLIGSYNCTGEAYIRSCSHGLTTGLIRLWLYPQWQSAGNSPGGRGISALAVVRNRFDINRSDNVSFYWTRTQGCGLIINATQLNNWLIVNAIALTFAPNVLGKHWILPIKPSIRMRQMRISMRVIYITFQWIFWMCVKL